MRKKIFIACPWTPLGGGMFKVADYLIQSQTPEKANSDHSAQLVPLDTRGGKHPIFSIFYLITALTTLLFYRILGQAAGIHINMAERLSFFRKSTVILFSRLIGLPVILHLHAAQLHHFYASLPSFLRAYIRWTFSKASKVIVLGETAKKFVTADLRMAPDKVEIVLNGVPEPTFPRTPYSATHNKTRVMFLGNLSERKGVSDLLNAIAKSQAFQDNKAEAIFVGAEGIEFYQNKANHLGISNMIQFAGWADQKQAAKWMATADILALPSYDEGLPLVILEALSNQVAVLCTPVGEIPNNLKSDENSLFVSPGNIEEITQALDKLILDKTYREHIAAKGRELYEKGFSLDCFSDRIAEVHQRIFGVSARTDVTKKGN
ncbi:glycosyltransferase family 4 protein [Nitrosomonas sp.]|uniref:glycosyltransferase family 4 protein n=1 Tax=Nitrosomonas sp. TaxID=42353 RepID=UPI0025FBD8DF|nr:glycosyltransferase family 4 protein [Nitrosomonas sp.]MBY0485341.1 glycosyltransferase family 4 protein [Nitrosomonas sp.]